MKGAGGAPPRGGGAALLAAGFALGVVLPPLLRRIRSAVAVASKKPSSSPSSPDGDADADENTTHAVRDGLSSSSSVRLPRDRLDAFLANVLVAAGCSAPDAELVAHVLTFADARGIPSHGCNRADTYVNEIAAGLVDASARPEVVKIDGCCALIDGKNGLGAATSRLAMETALKIAGEHGVAVAACRNSNHYGAAGYWAKMALERGFIGMSFTNTSPLAVPTGGRTRAVGTNPFCVFAPASDGDSFQLDMATTVVPIGKVEVMDRLGKPVPRGWGVDRRGDDCASGEEICKRGGLYPLGGAEDTAGYKGYGLGMFVEVLCAVLGGADDVGPDVRDWKLSRDGPLGYGHAFVVIDPGRFAPGFGDRLGAYLGRMRGLPGTVKVAGDPEREYERDAAQKGILLHENVAASLKALAARFGVTAPAELERLDADGARGSLYDDG